ncbi:MAG: hypothetical protein QXQ60_09215, partial [Thermofilum sp.]
ASRHRQSRRPPTPPARRSHRGEAENPLIFEIHLATREKLDWYKRHAKMLTPAQQLATSSKASQPPEEAQATGEA